MKVATHLVFAECCWFATSAVFDVHYGTSAVLTVAATSVVPDADYPKSWLGHQLGSVSEDLNRLFGHRSFLHSLLALLILTTVLGSPLWWITGNLTPVVAVFVGYGSHLFGDMMTLGGVQLFWPSRVIAVFPGRDEYRVVTGSGSERVFVAVVLVLAGLFYPVSRVGFDGLLYRLGGADQVYGRVTKVTDGDTISVEVYGQVQPVRLVGVDTPETVAPGQPVGCYGKEASAYTKRELSDRLIRLAIPRIGDSEDAYGRTLAYVYLDADNGGSYEHLFNEDLIILGLARTTTFSHTYRRKFERLREEAEERGTGLWSACPDVISYSMPGHTAESSAGRESSQTTTLMQQTRTATHQAADAAPPGLPSATWRVPACALGPRVMWANPRAYGHQPSCGRPVVASCRFCERSRTASDSPPHSVSSVCAICRIGPHTAWIKGRAFTKFNFVVYGTVYTTKRPRVLETYVMTSIARKYEQFVEAYRRPDGSKWGGQDIQDATGGVVTRSYITNLRKGRIENPGYEKLKAIAKVMNFPPELWFEDSDRAVQFEATDQHLNLSDRANHLFESIRDERTGEPYTNAQVARMSFGDLTEEEVEGIRTGSISNPSLNKVVALASVFSVHPSYFLEKGKKLPIIDEEALEIFRDETVSAIAHKSYRLPSREKQMILNIIQQFEDLRSAEERDATL